MYFNNKNKEEPHYNNNNANWIEILVSKFLIKISKIIIIISNKLQNLIEINNFCNWIITLSWKIIVIVVIENNKFIWIQKKINYLNNKKIIQIIYNINKCKIQLNSVNINNKNKISSSDNIHHKYHKINKFHIKNNNRKCIYSSNSSSNFKIKIRIIYKSFKHLIIKTINIKLLLLKIIIIIIIKNKCHNSSKNNYMFHKKKYINMIILIKKFLLKSQ